MPGGFKSKKSKPGAGNVTKRVARPVRERRAAVEPDAVAGGAEPMVDEPGAPAARCPRVRRRPVATTQCRRSLSLLLRVDSRGRRALLKVEEAAPHDRA